MLLRKGYYLDFIIALLMKKMEDISTDRYNTIVIVLISTVILLLYWLIQYRCNFTFWYSNSGTVLINSIGIVFISTILLVLMFRCGLMKNFYIRIFYRLNIKLNFDRFFLFLSGNFHVLKFFFEKNSIHWNFLHPFSCWICVSHWILNTFFLLLFFSYSLLSIEAS